MGDDGETYTLINLLIIAIAITIIFIGVLGYYGVKINNSEVCGTDIITTNRGRAGINSSYTLDNNTDYVLQELDLNNTKGLTYDFCFRGFIIGSKAILINIIDENTNTYGSYYVNNLTTRYCVNLDDTNLNKINYLGVSCPGCDQNNKLVLRKESLGKTKNQIYNDNDTLTSYNDNDLQFRIIIKNSCKNMVKFFTGLYLVTIFFLVVGGIIIGGYKKFRERFLEGW